MRVWILGVAAIAIIVAATAAAASSAKRHDVTVQGAGPAHHTSAELGVIRDWPMPTELAYAEEVAADRTFHGATSADRALRLGRVRRGPSMLSLEVTGPQLLVTAPTLGAGAVPAFFLEAVDGRAEAPLGSSLGGEGSTTMWLHFPAGMHAGGRRLIARSADGMTNQWVAVPD